MSARTDIKNALITKISAANTGVAIGTWDGEEAIFNSAHAWPSIAVAYAGTEFGESEELGATTYARHHVFQVFVCTAHAGSVIGDTQAMTILENSETAVAGQIIASLGQAEIIGEELVHVHMGRFLYVQTWKITLLESH